MRYRLDIAYDGSGFSGWARQPGLRTVQGTLEEWVAKVLRLEAPVPFTCAGRTDAGVHARGQVAHVDLPDDLVAPVRHGEIDVADALRRRLARALPDDVVVRAVTVAPAGFDARFSAVWRRYCYRIADAQAPDPLVRGTVVRWPDALDVDAMNAAAAELLGLRDFAAFCKRREGATTIRTLQELRAERLPDGTLATTVRADAFCHSMVRSLMGALTAVGSGRRDLVWLTATRDRTERSNDTRVMPAHGLVLEEVGYPDDAHLAARAAEARAIRCLEDDCS